MSVASVNIQKTIQRKRLVFRYDWEWGFNYALAYILGVILIVPGILIPFNKRNNNTPTFLIWDFFIVLWMFLNLLLLNALVRIRVDVKGVNPDDINDAVQQFFPGLKIDKGEQISRKVKYQRGLHLGRIVTIISIDQYMYLNITTLGRANMPLPFTGFYNFLKCKWIAYGIKRQLSR